MPFDPQLPGVRRDELIRRAAPRVAFGARAETHAQLGEIRPIDELGSLPAREDAREPPTIDAPADLVFTSGTTGWPKGVALTHRNLACPARHINAVIRKREDETEVLPLPLYHSFGIGRLRCNLIAGAAVALVDGFRLPGEIFCALERHRAVALAGVPAGFAVLLRFGARGLGPFARQLRYVEIGSAPMPRDHKLALMDLLPHTELWMHYGLTEASRSAFIEFHRHKARLDSAGLAAPGVRMGVRAEELWISGAHVAAGYWQDAELTRATFQDGWVRTGDLAHIDRDGFIYLHGRKDDMVNVGGTKIAPEEIETVLAEHPAVSEAACIGVPDPRQVTGQVLRAYLVRAAGQAKAADEALSKWVASRLGPRKVPAEYRWVESLPRTASGKLVRKSLREEAASEPITHA